MLRRIFLAINLPKEIKEELLSYQEKWLELPARWVSADNLHITLVFLGNTSEKELEEIKNIAKEIAQKYSPFKVRLSSIEYGPSLNNPRMVFANGEKQKELLQLQKDLDTALDSSKDLPYKSEYRPFTLHITLARLNEFEFKRIEPEERPSIKEEINLTFPVNSIDVMESKLKRGGAEYTIIESFLLNKQ